MENVIILGTGPAGLTAAIYAARAELAPIVLKGDQPGGQVTITDALDNYPGFPGGISGYELYQALEQQAIRFGAKVIADTAIEVDFKNQPFKIKTREQSFESKSVILRHLRWIFLQGQKGRSSWRLRQCCGRRTFFNKVRLISHNNSSKRSTESTCPFTKSCHNK